MARDNRPMPVQVAELTVEQKRSILRIALYHIVFSVLVLVLVLVFAVAPLYSAFQDYDDASDAYWNAGTGIGQMGARLEALEERQEAEELLNEKMVTCGIVMGAWILVEVGICLFVYKKYSYYSDGKCFYILRHRKALGV